MRLKTLAIATAIVITLVDARAAAAAPTPKSARPPRQAKEAPMSLQITTTSFAPRGEIPARHTCDGEDASPTLAWSGAPAGTKSFALIVDDPDAPDPAAPKMTWVHWVLYNIPTASDTLTEGMTSRSLPLGTLEGRNDWKQPGYRGPCPPIGRHRYFFRLFALDTVLADLKGPSKPALERAMMGHVLAHAELIGTYQHPARREPR
jgi:hypothetical protein